MNLIGNALTGADLTELYGRSNNDIIVEPGRRFSAYLIALRMIRRLVKKQEETR